MGYGLVSLALRVMTGTPPQSPAGTPPGEEPAPPEPPDVVMVAWVTDGNPCPACIANEDDGPYAPQDLPPLPQHPHCRCDTQLVDPDIIPASFYAAYLLS